MMAHPNHPSTALPCGLSEVDLDTIAWGFLGSEFTSLIYANWPIERRVDAYLAHHDMINLVNDGDAHAAVLQQVLANTGAALRDGTLPATTWATNRPHRSTQTADHDGKHGGRVDPTRGPMCVTAVASGTAIRGCRDE